MDLLGPALASLAALVLIVVGGIRYVTSPTGSERHRQARLYVACGVALALLLAVFFWADNRHWHRDAEGEYYDRTQGTP